MTDTDFGTTEDYSAALGALRDEGIHDKHLALLQAHFDSPNHTTTWARLADEVGYANGQGVNLNYGKLARVAEAMGILSAPRGFWLLVLVDWAEHRDRETDHTAYVLRSAVIEAAKSLGLIAEAAAASSRSPEQRHAYVTSRGFALSQISADEMAGRLWFNMWQRRLWPYGELEIGDTLYWYDSTTQAIVWNTTVSEIERFEYENKEQVRSQLQERFGHDPIDDPYYAQATDHGYCLACKVSPLKQLNLPKAANYKFPQGGWLRCSDAEARTWLSPLLVVLEEGRYTPQLQKSARKADQEKYFEPRNLQDERERTLREIVQRRGQPEFRNKLIAAYEGRCAVTECDAVPALEAAHVTPYLGPQSNHVSNGLLLRADIHTLFDLDLIGIDPESLMIVVAEMLRGTCYHSFDGQQLLVPKDAGLAPSKEALQQRWNRFTAH